MNRPTLADLLAQVGAPRGSHNRRPAKAATIRIVDAGPNVYTAKLYAEDGSEVGHAQVSTFKPSNLEWDCRPDVQELRARFGADALAWVMWRTAIVKAWRGRGWGVALYETLLRRLHADHGGPVILVPECCMEDGGNTSASAERVWTSLRKRWASAGYAIASVPTASTQAAS